MAVIRDLEQDAEVAADHHADHERRLWRGPAALAMHLGVQALAWTGVTHLIGALARRAGLDHPHLVAVDVPVADLPPALDGLRIGHLSDFHIGVHVHPDDARRAVDLLDSATPDVIVMTGDLLDHRPRDIVPAAQAMAGLRAPLGVYGVLGNHDHRVGGRRLLRALAEHAPDLTMLVNRAVPAPVGRLWVAGLDSVYLGLADARAALAAVPADAPCLLLSHEPDVADHLPRPVTLTLAGHAHGGQVRLGGRPLLLPPLGRLHHTGLSQSASGPVYTSRGVGWTGIPLRIACPAEVTVVRLTRYT
ncbi:MAG: metallophosphoesterase [Chloroflexi bacterium]|nr:metallophosphoesterase [Chloroflexota bacterium]